LKEIIVREAGEDYDSCEHRALDAGVNAPATVFEQNGKQYVAVFSAGNRIARTDRGDSVWLFALLDG
jgi:glucose dehydrogenase